MDYYRSSTGNDIPIIDDTPEGRAYAMPSKIDGNKVGYGYVPRDYKKYPEEMFDAPTGMTIFPKSEWDARWEEQEAQQSSLEHIYLSGPGGTPLWENLDQDGEGDCWAFDIGQAIMLMRMKQNQPLVRLNPHSIAVCLKQLNGGWCGLSAKFAREVGCAAEKDWSYADKRNMRLDTPEMRAKMAPYKIVEDWVDLTRAVYDQTLTEEMLTTCGFVNEPTPTDYNWWGHSVVRIRTVRIEAGSWGALILNSWKDWGRHGLAVLRGSQAKADSALAVRQVVAA